MTLRRSRFLGIRAVLFALTMAFTLAACTAGQTAVAPPAAVVPPESSDPNAGASNGGTTRRDLVVAVGAEPINLDFTSTSGAAIPQLLLNNVYETLVKIGQDGELEPLLAESWTVSDNRLVYDFQLRPDVTFSDGRPFNADDVVASFNRTQTDWLNAIAGGMSIIDHTEAIDDLHVRVTLKSPSNQWLLTLGTPAGAIFPADLNFDLATQAIGTGPFEVTNVSPGQHIVLTGRPDYWGGAPAMDQVTVRYLLDTSAAVNAFRAGEIDMMVNLASGDQTRALEGTEGVQVVVGTSTGDVLWSFNNRRPPFDDVRVRQAFAYAVDRAAVLESVAAGYGTLVGAMVTPQDPFFEDLSELFPYDPERARELLAEAGATNLNVSLDVPNLPYATIAAEVIQSYLTAVGVQSTINILEFPAVWLDQVFNNHDFDMSIIMHSEPWDLLTVFGSPDYYLGYDNPRVREQAALADAGTPDEWVAGMQAIVREIAEDVPAVVLYLAPRLTVANANLAGIMANGVTESLDLTQIHWR